LLQKFKGSPHDTRQASSIHSTLNVSDILGRSGAGEELRSISPKWPRSRRSNSHRTVSLQVARRSSQYRTNRRYCGYLPKWLGSDLKSVTGVKSARRYKTFRGKIPGADLLPYLAIYEIETDDLEAVSAEMQAKLRPFHPDFDRSRSAHIYAVQIAGDE
jgi:hypothetical protein